MFIAAVCEQVTTQQRPSVPAVTVTSVTDEDSNNSSNGRSSSAAQPAVLFEKVYGNYGETARTAFGGTCLIGQLLVRALQKPLMAYAAQTCQLLALELCAVK
eukprot:13215-Heterococcus_DN1.PRE.1